MKIVKKIFLIIIILSIVLGINANYTFADSSDSDLSLENVNYNIKVNSDGSMDVEEIWDIEIEDTNTLFKEFKIDKTRYRDIINGTVSIINGNGTENVLTDYGIYAYHLPTNEYYFLDLGDAYEIAWGTGLENGYGRRTYIIRYTVLDAIGKYNDISELYWQVFGSDFEIPIKKLSGTITLPESAENMEDIKVWGHSEALNGTINVTSPDTVSFEVNKNNAENMIEIRIAMPTDMIESSGRTYDVNRLSSIIQEETKWANEANTKRLTRFIIVGIAFVAVFAVLLYVFIKNVIVMKNNTKLHPTQELDYFRELPRKDATPLQARFIFDNSFMSVSRNVVGQIFTATVLNLGIKKAIKIESINSDSEKDSKIIINTSDISSITENQDEINVFNILQDACKKYGEKESASFEITVKNLKKYIRANESKIRVLANSFDKIAKTTLIEKNILSKEGIKKKTSLKHNTIIYVLFPIMLYAFIIFGNTITNIVMSNSLFKLGGISLLLLFILDIIFGTLATNRIDAYTQQGIDEQEKWKAFKKFMEDFSLLNEKEIPDIAVWEQYLVYATAFGIAEKVLKQLKVVYPEYMDSNEFANRYATMYLLTHTDFNKSFGSIGSTMSSTFSSGSGSGGGFSGGGGGGRRRRWRRRPLEKINSNK